MADILPELPDAFEDGVSIGDALALASKIDDMQLRVDEMDKIVPGAIAVTEILIDDVAYKLTLQRASS